MRGHRERCDALVAPIPTPFATLVSAYDDCFYYHYWRNNVLIVFGTLSS